MQATRVKPAQSWKEGCVSKGWQTLRTAACWLWEEQGGQRPGRRLAFTKRGPSKEGLRERVIPASDMWCSRCHARVPVEMQDWKCRTGCGRERPGHPKTDTMGDSKRDEFGGKGGKSKAWL